MPPQKKFSTKLIIIIGIIILILALVIGYILVRRQQLPDGESLTLRNLFPFGASTRTPVEPDDTAGGETPIPDGSGGLVTIPESTRLRQITKYPITSFFPYLDNQIIREPKLDEKTGLTIFEEKINPVNNVRFNAKRNGIISDAELTNESIIVTQKTSTEIPLAQELWFGNQASMLFFRTWNTLNREIQTMSAMFPPKDPAAPDDQLVELSIGFLPENIIRGSASPNTQQLFILRKTDSGAVGSITDGQGRNPKTVFTSPFVEWRPVWVNANTITMTTLASREANGYMYQLDPQTTDFKKIIGPLRGLTTLTNPDATKTLVTTSTDRGMITQLFNHADGSFSEIDLTTLAEKCTWQDTTVIICAVPTEISPGTYPDSWYQGIISFTDAFWKINISNQVTELLFTPTETTDGVHLGISPDKKYLYFINKNNGTLWSYRMSE